MRLSPPTLLVFTLSVILAGLVIAVKYFGVAGIPYVGRYQFETLLAAYVLLLLGNLVRGL